MSVASSSTCSSSSSCSSSFSFNTPALVNASKSSAPANLCVDSADFADKKHRRQQAQITMRATINTVFSASTASHAASTSSSALAAQRWCQVSKKSKPQSDEDAVSKDSGDLFVEDAETAKDESKATGAKKR